MFGRVFRLATPPASAAVARVAASSSSSSSSSSPLPCNFHHHVSSVAVSSVAAPFLLECQPLLAARHDDLAPRIARRDSSSNSNSSIFFTADDDLSSLPSGILVLHDAAKEFSSQQADENDGEQRASAATSDSALKRHFNMCMRLAESTAANEYVTTLPSQSSLSSSQQPNVALELLVRKLLILREQRHLLDSNGSSSSSSPSSTALLLCQTCVTDLTLRASVPASVRAVCSGILSSDLATIHDVLAVLTKLRSMMRTQQQKKTPEENNDSPAPLAEGSRTTLSYLLKLARRRLAFIYDCRVALNRNRRKEARVMSAGGDEKDDEDEEQEALLSLWTAAEKITLRDTLDKAFALCMQVPFSESEMHLFASVKLVRRISILDVFLSSKACYVADVLSRRFSCGEEGNRILRSVIDTECRFLLSAKKQGEVGPGADDEQQKQQQISSALSHALIALMMLKSPHQLLELVQRLRRDDEHQLPQLDDDFSSPSPPASASSSPASGASGAGRHWTAAWAFALIRENNRGNGRIRSSNNSSSSSNSSNSNNSIREAVDVLHEVARSRPDGWRRVLARVRNVFYFVGSRIHLHHHDGDDDGEHSVGSKGTSAARDDNRAELLALFRAWCNAVNEMQCASMRVDSLLVVPTMMLLVEQQQQQQRQQQLIMVQLALVAARNGIFLSDAIKVVKALLAAGQSSGDADDDTASTIVEIWRGVVACGYDGGSGGGASGNNFVLDATVLQCLLQRRQDHRDRDTVVNKNSLPVWARHIVRFPSLLTVLPQEVNKALLTSVKHLVALSSSSTAPTSSSSSSSVPSTLPLLRALHILVNSMISLQTMREENDGNNIQGGDETSLSSSSLVWACHLCETTNTNVQSTCGNDKCRAAHFAPVQCNACLFINMSCSTECAVCQTPWIGDNSNITKNNNNNNNNSNKNNNGAERQQQLRNFVPLPFPMWECSSCGTSNTPGPDVTSGLRCESCAGLTGPLVRKVEMIEAAERTCTNSECSCAAATMKTAANKGLMISSQDPACTTCGVGTLLPQEMSSLSSLSTPLPSSSCCWTCARCSTSNPSFRERCIKCVHVVASDNNNVSNGKRGEGQTTLSSSLSSQSPLPLSSFEEEEGGVIVRDLSFGVWVCSCGESTNSTDQSHCRACHGSIELHCAELFARGEEAAARAGSRHRLPEATLLCASGKTSSAAAAAASNDRRKNRELRKLSFCARCKKPSSVLSVADATKRLHPQPLLQKSKKKQQEGQAAAVDEDDEQQHQQHFGDFCTSPSGCCAPLPTASLPAMTALDLSDQQQQQHSSLSDWKQHNVRLKIDPVSNSIVVEEMKSVQQQQQPSNSPPSARATNKPPSTDFVSSFRFQLLSLRHNFKHLHSLLVDTRDDPEAAASPLLRGSSGVRGNIDESDDQFVAGSSAAALQRKHATIHALVRICARRLRLLKDTSNNSNNNNDCGPNLPSSSSPSAILFHEEFRSVALQIVALCAARWDAMTDVHTRGSLAASLQLADLVELDRDMIASVRNGRCRWCLGTHPEPLCPHCPLSSSPPTWACAECGEAANDSREGAQRYVCKSCLGLRQEVLQLLDDALWSEVWECPCCRRATPMIEDNCIFCPYLRKSNMSRIVVNSSSSSISNAASTPTTAAKGMTTAASLPAAHLQQQQQQQFISGGALTTLPFFPARCGLCSEVHLEALCPICSSSSSSNNAYSLDGSGKRSGVGVVSSIFPIMSRERYTTSVVTASSSTQKQSAAAGDNRGEEEREVVQDIVVATVQPYGTASKKNVILVPMSVLPLGGVSVGSSVRFDAQRSLVVPVVRRGAEQTTTRKTRQQQEHGRADKGNNNNDEDDDNNNSHSMAVLNELVPERIPSQSGSALCATSIQLVSRRAQGIR